MRLIYPTKVDGLIMMIIAGIGLIFNLIMGKLLHHHGHDHGGHGHSHDHHDHGHGHSHDEHEHNSPHKKGQDHKH